MSVMRTICVLSAALALSGCAGYSSYSGAIAQSRAEYERAVLAGERTAPPRRAYASKRPRPVVAAEQPIPSEASTIGSGFAQAPTRALNPELRRQEIAPRRDPALLPASASSDASPTQAPHPMGSPAWQREHAQWERMDNELKRKLQGICTGC
jgi:hypothetical protein